MYGGFHSWFYSGIAGLETTTNASSTGWRHFVVQPSPAAVQRLQQAGATVLTRLGSAAVDWAYAGGQLAINVTVPVGAQADVLAPQLHGAYPSQVCEVTARAVCWQLVNGTLQSDGIQQPDGIRSVAVGSSVAAELGPSAPARAGLRVGLQSGHFQLAFSYKL